MSDEIYTTNRLKIAVDVLLLFAIWFSIAVVVRGGG